MNDLAPGLPAPDPDDGPGPPGPNVGSSFRVRRLGHFRDEAAHARFRRAYERALAGLPVPVEVRDVRTGSGWVRAYRFGTADGVPLMLLPGRTASTPMWEPNLAGLAARRPVWAVDLLGEPGLSVQTAPLRDDADQAAWLAALITELGLPRVHLLGVSIGGWMAFNLAAREPRHVASVSLLDPAQVFGRITLKAVVVSLGTLPFLPRAWRAALLRWISGGADVDESDPVAALIASGMRDFRAFLPPPHYPADRTVAAVDVPALVVIAGRSIIHHPARAAARARRLLRHGTVELWPEASHAVNGEFPDRVDERVLAFLDEVEAGAGAGRQ